MNERKTALARAYLLLAAAVAGAAALALEVLAARTMAPAIGSGSAAWSSLLAVALAALALGNLLGGYLAERWRTCVILAWALPVAAAVLVAFARLYPAAMQWAAGLPLVAACTAAAMLTQLAPMFMLGAVSPGILAAGDCNGPSGRWAGAVLAAGSSGGIVGALGMGLAALPWLGVARSYLLLAALLAAAAAPAAIAERRWVAALLALLAFLAAIGSWLCVPEPDAIQSRYGQIEVRHAPDGDTLLIDGLAQTGISGPLEPWAGLRRGYLLEAALLVADRPRHALVVGLGGGLAPRLLELHGLRCFSVEIDPTVVDVARSQFGFRGSVAVADGRAYLARSNVRWDLIVLDVCTADRLALHLFTVESLRMVRERLAAGGVLAIQFIGDDGPWSASLVRTVRAVFPRCEVLAPAAELAPIGPRWIFCAPRPLPPPPAIDALQPELPWRFCEPTAAGELLTDDRFPAEFSWASTARQWRRQAVPSGAAVPGKRRCEAPVTPDWRSGRGCR